MDGHLSIPEMMCSHITFGFFGYGCLKLVLLDIPNLNEDFFWEFTCPFVGTDTQLVKQNQPFAAETDQAAGPVEMRWPPSQDAEGNDVPR